MSIKQLERNVALLLRLILTQEKRVNLVTSSAVQYYFPLLQVNHQHIVGVAILLKQAREERKHASNAYFGENMPIQPNIFSNDISNTDWENSRQLSTRQSSFAAECFGVHRNRFHQSGWRIRTSQSNRRATLFLSSVWTAVKFIDKYVCHEKSKIEKN